MIYCTACGEEMPKVRGEQPQVAIYCLKCVNNGTIPEKDYPWKQKGVDK